MKFRLIAVLALAGATGAFARGLEHGVMLDPVPPRLAVERVAFAGREAIRVVQRAGAGLCCIAPLRIGAFHDGAIEAWVAGRPLPGAAPGARGFIGIAFRIQADNRYEAFYIRPTNGRADDQLRRNHATQYISEPAFPWERLRREAPGVYESYADMEPGVWTHLRIEVEGDRARLFVNHAAQPALIVNDLKLGPDAAGGVALWVGDGTDGYFADVRVSPRG